MTERKYTVLAIALLGAVGVDVSGAYTPPADPRRDAPGEISEKRVPPGSNRAPVPPVNRRDLMGPNSDFLDDDEEFIGEDAEDGIADDDFDTGTVPQVSYDPSALPVPVRRLREQILQAAARGDLEGLRPIFDANGAPPAVSAGEVDDPIAFLKEASGDDEGIEILGILTDILEAGYVRLSAGTAQEIYVWPYFANYPLEKLTPSQKVEVYRVLTAADFAESRDFGAYIFYRVGIGADGTWHYFLSGD